MSELPNISNSTYGSTNTLSAASLTARPAAAAFARERVERRLVPQPDVAAMVAQVQGWEQPIKEMMKLPAAVKRRIVKVFIVDPNDNIPLEKAVLYQGDEKLTDLTDQELFYEINMAELLKKHNEFRVTVVDKTIKERTQNLEPARIRDLSMSIVTVVEF